MLTICAKGKRQYDISEVVNTRKTLDEICVDCMKYNWRDFFLWYAVDKALDNLEATSENMISDSLKSQETKKFC